MLLEVELHPPKYKRKGGSRQHLILTLIWYGFTLISASLSVLWSEEDGFYLQGETWESGGHPLLSGGQPPPRGGNTRRNTILYDMGGGGRREPMKNVKIQVWTVLLGAEPEQKRGKLSKPGGSGQLTLRRPTNSLHVSGWICSHARLRTPARRGSWPRQSVSPGGSSACPHVAPTRCLD
jgi:hypothetical protein